MRSFANDNAPLVTGTIGPLCPNHSGLRSRRTTPENSFYFFFLLFRNGSNTGRVKECPVPSGCLRRSAMLNRNDEAVASDSLWQIVLWGTIFTPNRKGAACNLAVPIKLRSVLSPTLSFGVSPATASIARQTCLWSLMAGMVLLAAQRRRNSAQGERSGTLGHEPNGC